eukprot:735833-Pyramimonas_sp.AAC.3
MTLVHLAGKPVLAVPVAAKPLEEAWWRTAPQALPSERAAVSGEAQVPLLDMSSVRTDEPEQGRPKTPPVLAALVSPLKSPKGTQMAQPGLLPGARAEASLVVLEGP